VSTGLNPQRRIPDVRLDVSTLSGAQLHELHGRIYHAGISFRQVQHDLLVPALRSNEVVDILGALTAEAPEDDEPFDPNPYVRVPISGIGVPAARWQRLTGAVLDGLLIVVVDGMFRRMGWGWPVTLAVTGAVIVVMVTLIGASPGKLVAGTRVVHIDTGRFPSLLNSALRWATPYAAGFLVVLGKPGIAVAVVVYFGSVLLVLFAWDGRAVHDLVAATIVVSSADGVGEGSGPARR
jgi:uncharacterized RDD family membrane protein YckC